MVMNAFDTNFDNENEIYAVNTVGHEFMHRPIPLKLNERVTSVDVPCSKDVDKPLVETITDEDSLSAADQIQEDGIRQSISSWVFQLPEKQREVICRRYGLCGYEAETLEEVAQELNVTRERVRQIQMEGLKRLKEILHVNGYSFESVFN
jgi:RNA polymerase nonessential primary-like sigma factor